ncbi:MAG: methionyl-tRNA formyltransferase [Phycisphaerae bacterium]
MRIVFMASGVFAVPTLKFLASEHHEIPLLVTQPARAAGRGRRTTRTPVAAVAEQLGLPVVEVDNVNEPDFVQRVREVRAEIGLAIAFGQMLRSDLLDAIPGGFINLHASLLPKYRGAAPINWAILGGEERTGCTVFRIDKRMDAGPILMSRWTQIKPDETAGELHDRLAGIGVDAVSAALELFDGGRLPAGTPQDDALSCPAPKLKKSDGIPSFDRPAKILARHICGMTPWPGVPARFESQTGRWENVQLVRARAVEAIPSDRHTEFAIMEPGSIDERRYLVTAEGFLELLEIKPSSGRIMAWRDFVNGRQVGVGDRFMAPEAKNKD